MTTGIPGGQGVTIAAATRPAALSGGSASLSFSMASRMERRRGGAWKAKGAYSASPSSPAGSAPSRHCSRCQSSPAVSAPASSTAPRGEQSSGSIF